MPRHGTSVAGSGLGDRWEAKELVQSSHSRRSAASTAYHEFVGKRKRNRIVDMPRLLKVLSMGNADAISFRDWYLRTLATKLACIEHRREPYWTQALAVGNEAWLRDTAKKAGMRRCPLRQSESGELKYRYDKKCPVKNEP